MAEIWDLVNENGEKVGLKWARADHDRIPDGLYHPCAEVWVRVGERLLVTRRHPNKSEGLKYDAPGGAVLSGESFTCGAVRELAEEVGIVASADELRLMGTATGGHSYAATYLLRLEQLPRLSLQPTEVVDYRLVSRAELDGMVDELCNGCKRRYLIYREALFE